MAKNTTISFGIGATIAGSFTSAFKTADSMIAQVNKKTAELKKNQANLKILNSLSEEIKKAGTEILKYETSINSLSSKIIENTQKNKMLKKEYSQVGNQINILENEKKQLNSRMIEISKSLAENKGNTKDLKVEYNNLSLKTKAVNQELQPLKNNFNKIKTEINENEKQGNSLQKQYDSLIDKTEKLKDSQAKNKNEISKVIDELKKQNISVNDVTKSYSELEKKAEAYDKALKKYETSINSLNSKIVENTQKNKMLKKEYSQVGNQINILENEKKQLNSRMIEISKSLAENKGNTKDLKVEYNNLSLKTKAVNQELQPLKNNFNKIKTEINENEKQGNSLQKQYDSLIDKTEKLKDSQAKNKNEISKVTDELKKQNISVNDVAKSYSELEKKAEAYNKALKKYEKADRVKNASEKVSSLGNKTGIAAGGVTAIGTVLATSAIKAESAFADVKKQFDFGDKKSEEEFKAKLQSLVTEKQMALSLEDLYTMAANAGSAGIDKDQAIDYIEQASKMAIAFGMDRDQASQYMFKWKNSFGMDINQLKELSDQINMLGNNTGATEAQISEFLTRLGNIPKLAGMAENQTAALGASLIEMGMTPEVAATGAKNLLNIFSKGDSATGAQKNALESLGLDPVYLAKDAQKDAQKAMDILFEKMGKVSKERQGEILATLFGEEGKIAAANMMESYEKYKVNRKLVTDKDSYTGATDNEYKSRAETTENQLQVLKTQFDIIKADLGTELLPYIKEGAKYLQDFLKSLTEMIKSDPEGLKKKAKAILYLTGALYGATAALKIVAGAMNGYAAYLKIAGFLTEKQVAGNIVKGFSSAGTGILKFGKLAIGAIGKVATLGFAALTSPVTWIILGITALVAAGYLLYKNWDTVKNKALELGGKIMELVDKYWILMGPLGVMLKTGKLIYQNWDTIKVKALELKDKIVEFVVSSVDNFIEFKDKAINVLGIPFAYLEEKWDSIKQKGKDTIDYFKEIFEEIKNFSITDAANKGLSWITDKIPGFAEGGIVTQPTLAMVGEGQSSEAIIPLNNSNQSLNLWEKTGRLLGANKATQVQENYSTPISFAYSPVIHAKDSAEIKRVLENDAKLKYEEFSRFMAQYQKERFRKGDGR